MNIRNIRLLLNVESQILLCSASISGNKPGHRRAKRKWNSTTNSNGSAGGYFNVLPTVLTQGLGCSDLGSRDSTGGIYIYPEQQPALRIFAVYWLT